MAGSVRPCGPAKEIPAGPLCDPSLLLISSPDCLCGLPSWGRQGGVRPHLLLKALALSSFSSPWALPFPSLLSCSCLLWAPPSYFLLDDVQALQNSGSGMGLCGGSHAPVTGFLTGNARCLFGHYREQHSGCGRTNFCITLSSSSTLNASYRSQYLKPGYHGTHFGKLGQEDCPRPSWAHYETLS